MSVQRIPVRVMTALIAPTVTVLTAVLVNKDSLEMEQFVKVHACQNVKKKSILFSDTVKTSLLYLIGY